MPHPREPITAREMAKMLRIRADILDGYGTMLHVAARRLDAQADEIDALKAEIQAMGGARDEGSLE